MLARLQSFVTIGLTPLLVTVEVDATKNLPNFLIVGLGDTAVKESRERIHSALRHSGLTYPRGMRITINLAPADVRKVGPRYDVPMALGILIASGLLDLDDASFSDTVFLGELALDGSLRHVSGVLPVALAARAAGLKRIVVPASNGPEAALVPGLEVIAAATLPELFRILCREQEAPPVEAPASAPHRAGGWEVDFADIRGQEHAKRALEIAAAGGHNVLMSGAPGAGKTLLAKAFRGILPPLSREEALEVTQIYSVADLLPRDVPLIQRRPFRAVHHTASGVSIVGGGKVPGPGEISLAHHGVLFLDELAEFPVSVLEVIRQPLEDRVITITRASGSVTFPASFTLIAAMNPPEFCGGRSRRIQRRISAPLLDRMDLMVDVQPVDVEDLQRKGRRTGELSEAILRRVVAARERQRERFRNCSGEDDRALRSGISGPGFHGLQINAQMDVRAVDTLCPVDDACERLLAEAARRMSLSARAYHRTIKVARTIADLAGSDAVKPQHIAEALQYRQNIGVGEY